MSIRVEIMKLKFFLFLFYEKKKTEDGCIKKEEEKH